MVQMVRRRRRALVIGVAAALTAGAVAGAPARAVSGGSPVTDSAYAFAAKVTFGELGACSGVLVAPQWVLTAHSCLPPGAGPRSTASAPAWPTTVTVGRLDLTTNDGRVQRANLVVSHPDRNLALLRLTLPVVGVTPVALATGAPVPGETLQALGFGRTATEWVPDKLHGAPVTVGTVSATTIAISNGQGGPTTCKGDAGGPAVRVVNGSPELVAVHATSWQGGCLGETETRRDATETRIDDLAGWIRQNTPNNCSAGGASHGPADQAGVVILGDWTGDCRTDVLAQLADGRLRAYASSGDLSGATPLFPASNPYVGTNWGGTNRPRVLTGDFTGDGRTDIIGQTADGTLTAWASTGDLSADYRLFSGATAIVGTGFSIGSMPRIIPGDFNGDGRTDLLGQLSNGTLRVWTSTGDLSADARLFAGATRDVGTGFTTTEVPRILTGDFNGDGRTDLIAQHADGTMKGYRSSGDLSMDMRLFPATFVAKVVGTGWQSSSIPRALPADIDGDGTTDLVAQLDDGRLRAFRSSGALTGDEPLFSGPFPFVGTNWGATNRPRILVGDLTGDGRADLIGQDAAGNLRGFRSTGDLSADFKLYATSPGDAGSAWAVSTVPRIF
ncbi:FG-GAP-like repeat-containing protein [Micromonospora sp. NPDC047074]|uniref:FG-GAP-like repeat-containing protein n=1 Tax=Micromonospora sp. NPDC047074 TaxID=3154339 RepID=UPI0033E53221